MTLSSNGRSRLRRMLSPLLHVLLLLLPELHVLRVLYRGVRRERCARAAPQPNCWRTQPPTTCRRRRSVFWGARGRQGAQNRALRAPNSAFD